MSNLVPKNNTQGEKVVLAYSGGLDTTCIVPWLKETFGYEVICCCVDVGQGNELDGLAERAKISGASKLYIEDITDDFCDNYVLPCLEANATYENKYLLGTSMARPAIAKKLVEIAPDLDIIAPWRMTDIWTFQSREDEYNYIKSKGIPLTFSEDNSYSRDRNLVHISHEGLELEDPSQAPNYDHMLMLSVTPEKAPDHDTDVEIKWENGVPVELNGQKMTVKEIILELNKLGGENGIGIIDIVENRVVGMKSRGVYETPGLTILMEAHKQIEELILDRQTMEFKNMVDVKFSQVVYEGKWFDPLREALEAFVQSTQKYVTGTTKMKLYKGNIIKAGTTSPYSLYNESLASFTTGSMYDHHDASGFITLFGLPEKVRAMKLLEVQNLTNNK